MPSRTIDVAKNVVRERIWNLLEAEGVVERGVHGHIPDFVGADAAPDRLADLHAWKDARVVKAVPDTAQLPVRARALAEGKTVYMAVPKLAEPKPFYLLDPGALTLPPAEAATMRAAAAHAPRLAIEELQPIDLVVCGSVAVNRHGDRIGKGAGYSDLEAALLHDASVLRPDTVIATTVHPLQVVDDELPATEHDFQVDLVVTPGNVIPCRPFPCARGTSVGRPPGRLPGDDPRSRVTQAPGRTNVASPATDTHVTYRPRLPPLAPRCGRPRWSQYAANT